jgi:hypothetical protein
VGLGGEVDDRAAAAGGTLHRLRVANVAGDELDSASLEVGGVAGVGELVEHDDVFAGPFQALGKVGADEAGAACNEYTHSGEA